MVKVFGKMRGMKMKITFFVHALRQEFTLSRGHSNNNCIETKKMSVAPIKFSEAFPSSYET